MNFKPTIAVVRIMDRRLALLFAVVAFVVAAPVFAHGGFDHVAGNVVKVSENVLTIMTSTGNVDVKLNAKTLITKDKQKAQLADLAPGVRVVIDIPEGSKDHLAHAVKIGNPAPAGHEVHSHDATSHEGHK